MLFGQPKLKRSHYILSLLLVAATLAVFWPVCGYNFVLWDDQINVYENPYLNPVTHSSLLHFWKYPYENLYIPLTYTVWAGLAYLAQDYPAEKLGPRLNPKIFHAANLLLHLMSVLAVFSILQSIVKNEWSACSGALLFALHPLQVEPVSWVTGTKDVLCGLLSLLAVWQYLRYAEKRTEDDVQGSTKNYVLATVAFLLALLAKPAAVVVPLLTWIFVVFGLRQKHPKATCRHTTLTLLPWAILALPFSVLTKFAQDNAVTVVTPVWARPLVAGDALTFYISKLLLPVQLGIDYGRSPEWVLQHGWILFTGLVPYAIGAAVWLIRDRLQQLLAPAALFLVSLLPVLGLVPFGFQEYSTVADRYVYLSMLGPSLAIAWLVSSGFVWIKRELLGLCCTVILTVLMIGSSFQTLHWHSNITLFKHAIEVNPNSSASHNNYGLALSGKGEIAKAIAHYREAIRIKPNSAEAYNNLGIAMAGQDSLQKAIEHFVKAIEIRSSFADAHYNLGLAHSRLGNAGQAIAHYHNALWLKPDDLRAHNNLANILLEQGMAQEAIAHYQEVLKIQPDNILARKNLSKAMTIYGKPQ